MINTDLQIELVSVEQIFPYWNNARNNKKTVKVVEQSIKKYGFNQPIAIDTKGEIIAGHTRYYAALNLGLTEIPCVRLDLSEEQCRQYRIADNKSHEFSTWDEEKLTRELRVLDDAFEMQDFFFQPISELLGFNPSEDNVSQGNGYESSPEEQKEVYAPKSAETAEEKEKEQEKFEEKQDKVIDKLSHEPTRYEDITCPHCGEIIRVKEE